MSVENIGANLGEAFKLFSTLTHVLGAELNLSAHFDGTQDTGVVELAHHATGSGVDDVPDRLTHLGDDPVNAGTDATREKAAAAVAGADGMSENERNAYNEARTGPMKETTVKELKMNGTQIIMADGEKGGVHAKRYLVDLPDDTKVKVFTYEYEGADGKMYQETGYIFETCSNPAVDASADQLAPVEPEAEVIPEVKPGVTYQVDPYYQDSCDCDPKKLLVATIIIPEGIVPGTPAYDEYVTNALAQIAQSGDATGSDYHKWTGVRIVDSSGKAIEAGCLKDGSTQLGEWKITDYKGNTGPIDPSRVDEVLIGANEVAGDGYVAPPVDAKIETGPGGKPIVVAEMPSRDVWVKDQLEILTADLVESDADPLKSVEAIQKVFDTQIPHDFFTLSFAQQVKALQGLGLSYDAAHDLAIYMNEFAGDPATGKDFRHFPIEVDPKPGETFGSYMQRAYSSYYNTVQARLA